MLGERIGEGTGKVTSQRALPSANGAPRIETSYQSTGTLLGVPVSETGTYVAAIRPDGTMFGEGQGILVSPQGELATWVGSGVGTMKKDCTVSYRGAVYAQSNSPKWARLSSLAVLFEFDVDTQGQTRAQTFEWK